MNYLIVDDEPIAHRIIEGYCQNLPYMKLTGNCYDALQAFELLNKQTVDLIFLDINMPKIKGFEFLRTLATPPAVIVTSAYQEFALEGYELNITDYLLKPFSMERFMKAVNKLNTAISEKQNTVIPQAYIQDETNKRIFLKGDKKHYQVAIDDILFVEAYGNYVKLTLPEETIITHEKISSFESILPMNQFIRVHKSFIVAVDKIRQVEGNRIFITKHVVPIGQVYRMNVNKLLGR